MKRFVVFRRQFPEEAHGRITGATRYNADFGWYDILIDKDLDEGTYRQTIKHELAHIVLGHFDDELQIDNIDEIEKAAEDYANKMTDAEFSQLLKYRIMEKVM